MKYIKSLGLLAVAAAALMAFAGSASATSLTSNDPNNATTPAIAASAGATSLDGAFTTITCQKSQVSAGVGAHGSGVPVSGKVATLDFEECNFPVTVQANGTFSIHGSSTTGNGTLTSLGAKISIHTSIGICIFETKNTDIGTVTGSNVTGGKAVLDITGKIPQVGPNFLCGKSGTWTGSYTVNTPSALEVH